MTYFLVGVHVDWYPAEIRSEAILLPKEEA
jgi:hypothetical protein